MSGSLVQQLLRWALSSLASSGEEANHKITSSKMVVDRETRSEKMPSKILKGIRDPRRRNRVFGGQDGWFCRYAWDFGGSQWKSNLPEGSYFTSQLTSCAGNCLRSKFSKSRRGPANSLSSGVTQINKVAQILKVAHAEMMRLGSSANNTSRHPRVLFGAGPIGGRPLSHLGRSKALRSAIGSAVDSRYP